MNNNMLTKNELAMVKIYKQYLSNNAYIPLQDLSRYVKVYKKYCVINNYKC